MAGQSLLWIQALPPALDEHLRRHGARQSLGADRLRPGHVGRRPRNDRQPGHGRQRGRRDGRQGPASPLCLGSVLNHVVLHQSVIGQEAVEQLRLAGEEQADLVIGCAGGGSNLAGLSFPFIREILHGRADTTVVAAEPAACPSITQGEYRYDHGDAAGLTPLLKMHTLGQDFVPDPIHAGGLRYHGMSPLLSHTVELGYVEGEAISQIDAFAAGVLFARTQGIVPAPESAHALASAVGRLRDSDEQQVVVLGLSGHGQLDLPAYAAYLEGELADT
ncbi:MAG TPA: pyridoxal-phosphate dependent enzyme [Propionibacteriaceae bacterium]|nr:pyridoxal-phosphate dependent enzyme [Propionibacteriaceae bacterium]